MNEENTEEAPVVFISYSHDSPSHKRWVGDLASKLLRNGVDVILDQWDLGLGDDIPKFMERGLTDADRVLMICTEAYVKKADEGEGGVGYEAMIVTGELVRNLGTSKFIPVILQKGAEFVLPKSVGTRFFVNLSEEQNFDEQFEVLLRELHKAPSTAKPPLGKNPFAKQPSGAEMPTSVERNIEIADIGLLSNSAESMYETSLEIARQGDLVSWRRIIRHAQKPISESLSEWRKKYEASVPRKKDALTRMTLEGASAYAPVFAIALAGIESGRERFNSQISLVDEILHPQGWKPSGLTIIVNFPDTVAYIYQALHGAMCLYTAQLRIAVKLARTRFPVGFKGEKRPLFKIPNIVGWPESLGTDSKVGWDFLMKLPDSWRWLDEPFGDKEDFASALCAYYLTLHVLELADTIALGKESVLHEDEIMLDIPIRFLQESNDIVRKGYRFFINDPAQVRAIWRDLNVQDEKMQELWPHWIRHAQKWSGPGYQFRPERDLIHKDLFSDIM